MKPVTLLNYFSRATLMILCLSLSACWRPPEVPFPPDAYEPNDTLSQATALVGTIEGRIQENEAPDMYFFTLEAGKRTKLMFTWKTNSNSPRLELFDPNGVSLGRFVSRNAATSFEFEASTPPSSLKAFPASLEFEVASAGKYTISLTSYLTQCPPEAGCPFGRSTYTLGLP
jgi:hypothetical protein